MWYPEVEVVMATGDIAREDGCCVGAAEVFLGMVADLRRLMSTLPGFL